MRHRIYECHTISMGQRWCVRTCTSAVLNSPFSTCAQVDKEGGVGMEDAAGFFANVFGGERFNDYVCGTPLCSATAD